MLYSMLVILSSNFITMKFEQNERENNKIFTIFTSDADDGMAIYLEMIAAHYKIVINQI